MVLATPLYPGGCLLNAVGHGNEGHHPQGRVLQGAQRAVELSTLGPHTLSFSSQTSSQLAAEERGAVLHLLHCIDVVLHDTHGSLHKYHWRHIDDVLMPPGVVEAEVFENERFLPFRGWGHEWPGHLLPTDRVGHWSLRGDRPSGAESMDFHRVAPTLPKVRSPSKLGHSPAPCAAWLCKAALTGRPLR